MPAPFELGSSALGPVELGMLRKRLEELRGEFGREEEQDALHAGAARSAYEDLASAPAPQQGLEAGIQQLFGDMGSIISRRPEFGERTREDVKQRGAMLLQQRIQNVQILRDRYQEEAAKIGKFDPVKSLEYAEKVERQNKLLEQLHERDMSDANNTAAMKRTEAEQAGAGSRAQLAADTDITVANINSQAEVMRWLASNAGKTPGMRVAADERTKLQTAIRADFVDPKTKKIYNVPMYKEAQLAVPPTEGQTEQAWVTEMGQMLMAVNGDKKLSQEDTMRLMASRATKFPSDSTKTVAPPAGPPRKPSTVGKSVEVATGLIRAWRLAVKKYQEEKKQGGGRF